MNTEIELRKWLNRSTGDVYTNLSFGLKAWHSIELALPTKYEIVLDELCNLLLTRDVKLSKRDAAAQQKVWDIVNELLGLTYSTGAVSVQVKAKLISALSQVANDTLRESSVSVDILNALVTTLHNTSMLNYYKSSVEALAKFIAIILRYLHALFQNDSDGIPFDAKSVLDGLLRSLRGCIRQTPYLDEFKNHFAISVFIPLCESSIFLQFKCNTNFGAELIGILQELYFDGNQTKEFKQFLEESTPGNSSNFSRIFQGPLHAHFITLETAMISFKNDADIIVHLFKYLFDRDVMAWTAISDSNHDLLNCVTHFLYLLNVHDISINFEIDSKKAHVFLGTRIEALVRDHHEEYPLEVMNVVCAALRLNALILEHTAVPIVVKFMLVPKTDESLARKYEELMWLLIEMFRKLCRPEKLVSQLIKNIWETLSTVKLSKKLKRKLNQSFAEGVPSSKAARIDDEDAAESNDRAKACNVSAQAEVVYYFDLLRTTAASHGVNDKQLAERQSHQTPCTSSTWREIVFAFPPSVAVKYTKLISGLVSKPSLVIWKTLIFALKDYVAELQSDAANSEKTVFLIEITSALLSQYLVGSRLAEQTDNAWHAIEANRKLSYETLAQFGHVIINQEHNYRTMNAFLKLCINVSNFDLICWYYCPDSMHANVASDVDSDEHGSDGATPKINGFKNAQSLHSYLSQKEWTIIEQRITNFGKRDCKSNINQIYLQRVKATFLFREVSAQCMREDVARSLLSSTFNDTEQIAGILSDNYAGPWFIHNLEIDQKRMICELILDTDEQDLSVLCNDRIQDKEYINVLVLVVHKFVIRELCAGKKAVLLKNLTFETIFNGDGLDTMANHLVDIIRKYANGEKIGINKIKPESHEQIARYLNLLDVAPVGFCSEEVKNILALFNIIIYHNFKSADDVLLSAQSLNQLRKILHFDQFPAIFHYIQIKDLIRLFNSTEESCVFDVIFDRVAKNVTGDNCKMLNEFLEICAQWHDKKQTEHDVHLSIAVIAVVQLSKNKKAKEHFDRYRSSLLLIIRKHFDSNRLSTPEHVTEFVQRTLSAFVTCIKSLVTKAPEDIDDQLVGITKQYLKESINCKNACSVKLLNVVLNNKDVLKYEETELKEIIDGYWANFRDCCSRRDDDEDHKNDRDIGQNSMETALKLIFDFKSTKDWIHLLNEIDEDIRANLFTSKGAQNNRILLYMSKCQFNKAKGQIYSEFYKQITCWASLTLRAKENGLTLHSERVQNLMRNHINIVNNVQIPVSLELIDDITSFMAELNIKKFDFLACDLEQSLHILRESVELIHSMINQRHFFIMDRIAQFVHIFKDALQAVCWYKSQRAKTQNLDIAEVSVLAEVAHNLEKISKSLVSHAKDVKRVAPYVLIFIINLMISNDRPLTLYPKIKTYFEYICYDLIAVCDHRTDSFILRCCNEASKPVYENLVKEYHKYHKFKGKV